MSKPHDPDEIIAVVDDNGNVIGKCPRGKVHADGMLHRETSVLIINSKKEILVQTRADNGRLDYSASGHFPFNENYLDGAIREVKEELGLDIPRNKFVNISKYRIDIGHNNRFITLWEVRGDYKVDDMKIDLGEVKSVKYMAIPKLKRMLKENPDSMPAGFRHSLQIYFKKRGL